MTSIPGLTLVESSSIQQADALAPTNDVGTFNVTSPAHAVYVQTGDYLKLDYGVFLEVNDIGGLSSDKNVDAQASVITSGDASVTLVHSSNPRFVTETDRDVEDPTLSFRGKARWKVTQAGVFQTAIVFTYALTRVGDSTNLDAFNSILDVYRAPIPSQISPLFAVPRSVPAIQYQET